MGASTPGSVFVGVCEGIETLRRGVETEGALWSFFLCGRLPVVVCGAAVLGEARVACVIGEGAAVCEGCGRVEERAERAS